MPNILSILNAGIPSQEKSRNYLKLLDKNAERYLMLVFYFYVTFIIVAEVFRRFVLGNASVWGEETARFGFIYLTWLGASLALRNRQHIRIDILLQYVTDRTKAYLFFLSDIVVFVFIGLTLVGFAPVLGTILEQGSVTQALRISRAYFYFAIPLSFILMFVRAVQVTHLDARSILFDDPLYEGKDIFQE